MAVDLLVRTGQLSRAWHRIADRRADLDRTLDSHQEEERRRGRTLCLCLVDADQRLAVLAPVVEGDRLNLLVLLELLVGRLLVVPRAVVLATAERDDEAEGDGDEQDGLELLEQVHRILFPC